MSAVPVQKLSPFRDEAHQPDQVPFLKLHRCRLDYDAAFREHLRGACASRVARAAGSKATSTRNLRRVGLKIVAKLESQYDVLAAFDRLGYTVADFCRGVIEQTEATKTKRYVSRGKIIAEYTDPDWRARTAARRMYLEATGILELPVHSTAAADPDPQDGLANLK